MSEPFLLFIGVDIARFGGSYELEDDQEVEDDAPSLEEQRAQFEVLLSRIPPREADAIELTLRGFGQDQIGAILAEDGTPPLTQSAVSYLLSRAIKRLHYWKALLDIPLTQERVETLALRLAPHPKWGKRLSPERHAQHARWVSLVWLHQDWARALRETAGPGRPDAYYWLGGRNRWTRWVKGVERAIEAGDPDPDLVHARRWIDTYVPQLGVEQPRRSRAWRAHQSWIRKGGFGP